MDIGLKIRQLRINSGDTLQDLSRKINYDYSNLSKVERGKYKASPELLSSISEVYNIDMRYFFEDLTVEEGQLLKESDLSPSNLEAKYTFEVDGEVATVDEIQQAIRLIRYLRLQD